MKSKVRSMACAVVLSACLTVQTFCPAVSIVMADIADEPDITIETTETSQNEGDPDTVETTAPSDTSTDITYIVETEDLIATESDDPESDEEAIITSATDTDPTDEVSLTEEMEESEETEETEEDEEIEYVVFDHYYSDIDDSLVNTSELFVITDDPSVFTRNTNVVSNFDNAYVIACDSVEEARFVYSYYVDKVSFITDMSDTISVCTDDEQEPDVADLSDINNGSDAIANLNDIDISAGFNGNIALIDTGASANVNYSVIGDDPSDNNGHGSSMLGFIREENPYARVVSIKVSEDGNASVADIYAGFRLAIDLNVSVINFSMTGLDREQNAIIKTIIQEALDAGIIVIGSAGNNGISTKIFIPGSIDGVITVGAVDEYGRKIARSNYNADLYVVAESTSEAAARYTGLYTAGIADISGKVFDQVPEDDDYVPDDYSWAYDVAAELTDRIQAELGYGYVTFDIDDDGNVWFYYNLEDELNSSFNVSAWNPSIASLDVGTVSYEVANGTYFGTCYFDDTGDSSGTGDGRGTASGFTGTLGSWLAAAPNYPGYLVMICSKNFVEGDSASNHALALESGQVNYTATFTDGTWTIFIGTRPGATQPEWQTINDTVSYTVSNTDGANLAVTVGGTTRYVPLTQAATGVVTEVTDLVRSMTVVGEYNGNKNCSVSVPNTGIGTHYAQRQYQHTDDTQAYEGVVTSSSAPHFAFVEFNKVGPDTSPLAGAIIQFVCTGGEGVGHENEIRVYNHQPDSDCACTYNGHAGVQFTTNGATIRIEGLRPNSTYQFHEYQAPLIPNGGGQRYALAPDQTITVAADGNCSPGTITMQDGDNPKNPDFSSISILKIWEPSSGSYYDQDGSFWSDASFVSFALQYRGSWDTYSEYGWGDSLIYGRLYQVGAGNTSAHHIDPVTGLAYWPVGWDCSREAAVNHSGMDTLYSGDNARIEGRYYQHLDDSGQFVDNEGTWTTDITYLPFGYYHITEYWEEAYMSLGGQKVFIESANSSGWFLEAGGPGTGSCLYGIIIKIDANGTHICNRDGSIVGDMPLEGGVRVARAQNESHTARLDVTKVDESGSINAGEAVVSFEVHSASDSNPLIATGILNTNSGTLNSNGFYEYDVNWTYSYYQSYRTNDSIWHYSLKKMNNEPFVGHLNYGNYYIYEFIRDTDGNNIAGQYRIPEGWSAWDRDTNSEWHVGDRGEPEYFYKLVTVGSANHTEPYMVTVTNRQYRFVITVNKDDEATGTIITSGYPGSTPATFALYIDNNSNGVVDPDVDTYIATYSDTDRDGVVVFDFLFEDIGFTDPNSFPTRFLVIETEAPDGYYLNDVPVVATVTNAGNYRATVEVVDTPHIRLSFGIDKYDEWTESILNGYDGPYDATFELWVDVNGNGQIDEGTDRLIDVLSDTDRDGRIDVTYTLTPELIRERFPECINADGAITGDSTKNYPTEYLVREITAPYDFYLNTTVLPISLSGRQYEETASRRDVDDTPYTAQIHMYKIDDDTGANIATARFVIYNDVDGNHAFTEGVDTVAQTYTEVAGLHDAQIVWNQARGCYVSSPLRSGSYVVVETGLPNGYFYVGSDGQPTLARNEVYFEVSRQDVSFTPFETPREDVYEGTVYNLAPRINTTFHDPVTMSQVAHIDTDCELVDIVAYENLIPNVSYVMEAVVYVKETVRPLTDEDGELVTGRTVFVPDSPSGVIEVSITLDTERLMRMVEEGTLNAPVDLVCYEYCSFNTDTDMTPYHQWYDVSEGPFVQHTDINDQGQTVRVGEIKTGVYDSMTLSQVASTGENGDGYATIIDHVHYEGLQPGTEYTMYGEMHLLAYDDNGNAVDGGVISGADGRENLNPSTTFTPTDHEGYVDVVYTINVNRLRGETLVSFETCRQNGVTIMWHCDIEDLHQTLFIPDVHTNAYCADTTPGDMGRTVIGLDQRARIVDEVSYENLLVDGRQYKVEGYLYWEYTDENGNIHSGPMADIIGEAQATATVFFTPDEQDGTIEMLFTFDSTVLADLHYDRLVVCETIYANGGIGWAPIAHHWDFSYENNAQSIYVPDIRTTAFTEMGTVLPELLTATITDRVFYENLVPGTEYTVVGNIQYAITDANGNVTESGTLIQNGEEVKAQTTFIPTSSSGYVELIFTVNALDIIDSGYNKLVVFEELYVGPGVRCAIHADINDRYQTIDVPGTPPSTPPDTPDVPKTGDFSDYAALIVSFIATVIMVTSGLYILSKLEKREDKDPSDSEQ